MQFELLRAHQRFLPLIGQRQRRPDDEAIPLTNLLVSPAVKNTLLNALGEGGPHSGPLFGYRDQSELHVRFAAARGYSAALAPDPLAMDPLYLLGLTDAYRQTDPRLDWTGQWLTARGGQFPNVSNCLRWFERAAGQQLVTPEHPLVFAGWMDESFTLLACHMGPDEFEPCIWLPLHFTAEPEAQA
ncbi:hypothetical protein [Deinococcus marmoris]|uniref:Uncharacterized protein n=1 Tax=Deinococcus marmoris TaxID=249408 RepID=A0A1U7NUY8_9DEIO|nr:hypothetical protein [Deinococcus marmoris]OLV16734.1 hypothetical protein BOO71_0010948 [Deinococcus marmoris]